MDTLLSALTILVTLSMVSSLNLPYLATAKPRHTKHSSTAAPNATRGGLLPKTASNKGVVHYRVPAPNGATCILLKTDGLIEVYFKSQIGDEQGDTYMSDDADIDGSCTTEDSSTMSIKWGGYHLEWNFAKTPGGERWYVDQVDLYINTKVEERYHTLRSYGKNLKLSHTKMLFPTEVGNSYACDETVVDLTIPEEEYNPANVHGRIYLRQFQVQPFMYKGSYFGPASDCNSRTSFRDETTPIAVGSTLAIAVLAIITGYGIYRYFKVKNVQYNAME